MDVVKFFTRRGSEFTRVVLEGGQRVRAEIAAPASGVVTVWESPESVTFKFGNIAVDIALEPNAPPLAIQRLSTKPAIEGE